MCSVHNGVDRIKAALSRKQQRATHWNFVVRYLRHCAYLLCWKTKIGQWPIICRLLHFLKNDFFGHKPDLWKYSHIYFIRAQGIYRAVPSSVFQTRDHPSVSPLACRQHRFTVVAYNFTVIQAATLLADTDWLRPSLRQITCTWSCTWPENSTGLCPQLHKKRKLLAFSVDCAFYRKHFRNL